MSSLLQSVTESFVHFLRKISTVEKGAIARGLTKLPAADLQKALDIITNNNSNFTITQEGIDIDIDSQVCIYFYMNAQSWFSHCQLFSDSQSNSTLWRLKFFIKSRMQALQENYKCIATNAETDLEKPAPKRRRKNAQAPK